MDDIPPLKAFRESQEPPWSQKDLAAFLGVSRVTVTRWESGRRRIDGELVPSVSKKTGIPAGTLRPDLAEMFGHPQREAAQ